MTIDGHISVFFYLFSLHMCRNSSAEIAISELLVKFVKSPLDSVILISALG